GPTPALPSRVRVDPVLVVASAAVLGGLAVAAPLAVVCTAVGLGLVLAPRVSRVALGTAVLLLIGGAVRAALAVPAFENELERVRAALGGPRRCAGVARIETSPTWRADSLTYVARFESLDCETRAIGPVLARLHGGPVDLARGDRVELVAQLASTELFRNAELPDPTPGAARVGVTLSGGVLSVAIVRRAWGIRAVVDRARAHVRERIDATFVPEAAPLARALVIGENDLSDGDSAAFRASGLSHLLAVSGTHLVFAVLGVVRALAFLLARVERVAAHWDVGRFTAAFGAVLAPLYADFAGGSGSAWRAAWMLAIGLGARALGKNPSASRSFALSLGIGEILDPLVGFDVSFMLSAAATAGLLGVGQPLAARAVPENAGAIVKAISGSLVATVSAMLPCAPLLAMLGPTITLAGIAANVAAVPFGEVISLPLCLIHTIAHFPLLERGIGLVASGALLVVRLLARGSASATWLAVPVPPPSAWHMAVLGVGGLGAAIVGAARWTDGAPDPAVPPAAAPLRSVFLVGAALGVVIVECAATRAGRPRGALRVTVLDVGQGDSSVVDLPDGTLMLIDGGGFVGSPVNPGASVILPLLRQRRRNRVDIAVLSHPHPDHYLGLATTLVAVGTGELWDTGQGREQGAGPEYHAMLADLEKRGVPVRGPGALCGPARTVGGAKLSVFEPCPSFEPTLGANDNSFIIKIEHGSRAALFMGDAEHAAEQKLLEEHVGSLHADLLKAGHHGSRTSTSPALLSAVRPGLATVSCGVRNRFGHPHPFTLAALATAGVPALRTDLLGSVEWVSEGGAERTRAFGGAFAERVYGFVW
ncbi:MAG TPA: ComEC/Rec2 family competence protein, partial [Polyangiaceae bacterium]